MPRLKIRSLLDSAEKTEICDLEQAKSRFAQWPVSIIVVVEGHAVNSQEELAHLVSQERYQDREFLDVMVMPVIEGG